MSAARGDEFLQMPALESAVGIVAPEEEVRERFLKFRQETSLEELVETGREFGQHGRRDGGVALRAFESLLVGEPEAEEGHGLVEGGGSIGEGIGGVEKRVELGGNDGGEEGGGLVQSVIQDGLPRVEEGLVGGLKELEFFKGTAESTGQGELEMVVLPGAYLFLKLVLDGAGPVGQVAGYDGGKRHAEGGIAADMGPGVGSGSSRGEASEGPERGSDFDRHVSHSILAVILSGLEPLGS